MLLYKLHVNDIQINICMKHVKPTISSGFTKHTDFLIACT